MSSAQRQRTFYVGLSALMLISIASPETPPAPRSTPPVPEAPSGVVPAAGTQRGAVSAAPGWGPAGGGGRSWARPGLRPEDAEEGAFAVCSCAGAAAEIGSEKRPGAGADLGFQGKGEG